MAEEFMPTRMPFYKRFRDVRSRLVPVVVFILCVFAAVRLWPRAVVLPPATGAGIAASPARTGSGGDSAIRSGATQRPADDSRRPTAFGGKFQVRLEEGPLEGATRE